MNVYIERSRQSARECRARKKLRYQYLEELVSDREKAVIALRKELEKVIFNIGSFMNFSNMLLPIQVDNLTSDDHETVSWVTNFPPCLTLIWYTCIDILLTIPNTHDWNLSMGRETWYCRGGGDVCFFPQTFKIV